jgi:DNA-binding transcriptional MocR family regulator
VKVTTETKFAIVPEWLVYAEVSDVAVRLYAVLARHADQNGRSHPSRSRLAELMRCSTKTVDRAAKELAALGALDVNDRFRGKAQTSNEWHIRTSDPATPLSLPLDRGDISVPRGGDVDVSQNESQSEREVVLTPRTPPTSVLPTLAPAARAKDPIYEVLFLLAAGQPYNGEARKRLTKTEADQLNAASREISATGISAADLHEAIAAWPAVFPDATCTPHAVKKYLATLIAASNGMVARRGAPSMLDQTVAEAARVREKREERKRRREVV